MNELSFSKTEKVLLRGGINNVLLLFFVILIFITILFIHDFDKNNTSTNIGVPVIIIVTAYLIILSYKRFVSKLKYDDNEIKILTTFGKTVFKHSDIKKVFIKEQSFRRVIVLTIYFGSNSKVKKYYLPTDYVINENPDNLSQRLNEIFAEKVA
jgi:hypothetical protein